MRAFKRGDHVELARALLKQVHTDQALRVFDEGELYRYHPTVGLWGPVTLDDQSRIVQKFAGSPVISKGRKPLPVNLNDVKGAQKLAETLAGKPEFFAEAPPGIAFTNGFVEVTASGITLKPHAPEHRVRTGFACAYEPDAKSAIFDGFVASLFKGDEDAEAKARFLQEVFGVSLIRAAYKYQVCALCIGDGENGKDTLIDVLSGVFPGKVVVGVSPEKWKHEYYRAKLVGAWLNIISELPDTDLEVSEAFKSIIAGGSVDARHPYGRVFNFRPIAGHVFATNAMMGTPDFSHGFFRRFGIVRFNRVFSAKERDTTIKARLLDTERPAIISWLLKGAARLIKRDKYELPKSHAQEMATWKLAADQVATFFDSACRPLRPGEKPLTGTQIYAHYSAWASANGHKPVSSTKFGGRAKAALASVGLTVVRKEHGMSYPVALGKGGLQPLQPTLHGQKLGVIRKLHP